MSEVKDKCEGNYKREEKDKGKSNLMFEIEDKCEGHNDHEGKV